MKDLNASIRTCFVCGKEFSVGENWQYKRHKQGKTYLMCSYGCTRWWDERYRKNPVRDRRFLLREAIRDGKDNGQIMVLLGYSYEEIDRCRKRMEAEDEMEDRCIVCGAVVPEGRQVCPRCQEREEAERGERKTESEAGGSQDR